MDEQPLEEKKEQLAAMKMKEEVDTSVSADQIPNFSLDKKHHQDKNELITPNRKFDNLSQESVEFRTNYDLMESEIQQMLSK